MLKKKRPRATAGNEIQPGRFSTKDFSARHEPVEGWDDPRPLPRPAMDIERLNQRAADFIKATSRLEEACAQPFSSFVRDSVIQRFEFCWELAWKALKLRLEQLGVEALNPRDTFREALSAGLIDDGNAWTEVQKKRNLTSHTYDEALADEVYAFILEDGLKRFQALAEEAGRWRDEC